LASRFKDFDAAWAESILAPLTVKVKGKTYDLPAKLPAKVVLIIARTKMQGGDPDAQVPLDTIVNMLEPFFGGSVLTEWIEAGIDVDQLSDIFKWSMSMYGGDNPDEKDPETEDDEAADPKA